MLQKHQAQDSAEQPQRKKYGKYNGYANGYVYTNRG
jgi:hypothetical protein